MQSILARLHTDHANMSSLLDIFENELAKIEQAEDADFEIISMDDDERSTSPAL